MVTVTVFAVATPATANNATPHTSTTTFRTSDPLDSFCVSTQEDAENRPELRSAHLSILYGTLAQPRDELKE
jgi:hypothetical protein